MAEPKQVEISAACQICGEAIQLGSRWIHRKSGRAKDGCHWAWPKDGTVIEAEIIKAAPEGSLVAWW